MDGTSTPYDYERTARFAAFGMAMGPPVGAWLKFLDRTFPFKGGSAVGQTVKRVLADQVVL
jgi:protein Mpv17